MCPRILLSEETLLQIGLMYVADEEGAGALLAAIRFQDGTDTWSPEHTLPARTPSDHVPGCRS